MICIVVKGGHERADIRQKIPQLFEEGISFALSNCHIQ